MTEEVKEGVIAIIAEQAMVEPDAIKTDTQLEDLGLDSLALVEVVFGIEEKFDVTVPYNANEPSESDFKLSNVQEVIEGVAKLVADKA